MYDHPQDDSHHPTAFNLRCAWQRRVKRSCFPKRQKSLWPTWKQHQINQTFTHLQNSIKKKIGGGVGFQTWETYSLFPPSRLMHHPQHPLPTFTTFIHLSQSLLFLLLLCLMANRQIWRWTCQCRCVYSKLRGCISVCFSPHNEERDIPPILLFSVWHHWWHRWS